MTQSASQTVGPFFRIGMIYGSSQNVLVNAKTAGERIIITGKLLDGNDAPIPDAVVEIWQPDANGIFNHPADPLYTQADPHFRGFGRAESRNEGRFRFETIKPGSRDGTAPYINVNIFARGMLVHAITRIYFADEAANADDPVLSSIEAARRQTLIATRQESGGKIIYHFNIKMQGENETVFFRP